MTFKFLLAFALCYWLFTNGKLDFSLISKSFHLGYLWVLGIIFLILKIALNAFRFKLFLEAKSQAKISYTKVFSFDAVGNFFSVILPGSAGGDVVRFFYYKNIDPELTPPTIGSLIILDRFMGLLGLMALGSIVCLLQLNPLKAINPALVSLIYINIFLMVGVALFILIFFSNLVFQEELLKKITKHLVKWPKISSVFSEMLLLKFSVPVLATNLFISILSQLLTVGCFWALISPFIPDSVSFFHLFAILPIGLIGASIPIAPAGLGVGHLFFENLFTMLHIEHGASLFNLFFIVNVAICLLGVIPYLLIKNEMQKVSEVEA